MSEHGCRGGHPCGEKALQVILPSQNEAQLAAELAPGEGCPGVESKQSPSSDIYWTQVTCKEAALLTSEAMESSSLFVQRS